MNLKFIIIFPLVLLLLTSTSLTFGQFGKYEVYYVWSQIDYNFPNDSVRNELIENGNFIQLNCVPTAIKVFQNQLFVTTPRYLPGIPATLSVIPYRKSWFDEWFQRNAGPKLTPFPSWEMQEVGNCSALQLVQAVEVDPYGRLWIVDVGRPNLLTEEPLNGCPAKLVIVDLTTSSQNQIERVYEFPNEVVAGDTNALKDIQIACTSRDQCHAYISNINGTNAIVVYDYLHNDSWYATHPTMYPDMDKANVTIAGTSALVPFGITGLGLTPRITNYSTLYYSQLAGDHVYTVPISFVNNAQVLKENPNLPDDAIHDLGPKPQGQADGTAMDNRGRWFYGSLPETAVYSIDTAGNPGTLPMAMKVVGNERDMQWIDTFTFDNFGYLLFTTNRFQLVDAQMINPKEPNFRIIRVRTDSFSYQT